MDKNEAKSILEACLYELSNQMGSEWCRKKYEAIQEAIKALEQPEIIRCKNCKNADIYPLGIGRAVSCSSKYGLKDAFVSSYCSYAERKTDEEDLMAGCHKNVVAVMGTGGTRVIQDNPAKEKTEH